MPKRRLPSGLRPGPPWGSLQRSSDPPAKFGGRFAAGKGGKGRRREEDGDGREKRRVEKRRGDSRGRPLQLCILGSLFTPVRPCSVFRDVASQQCLGQPHFMGPDLAHFLEPVPFSFLPFRFLIFPSVFLSYTLLPLTAGNWPLIPARRSGERCKFSRDPPAANAGSIYFKPTKCLW